jgi:hypothetical protein
MSIQKRLDTLELHGAEPGWFVRGTPFSGETI